MASDETVPFFYPAAVPSRGAYDGASEPTPEQLATLNTAIQEAVSRETQGLRENKDKILEEKRKLKEQFDTLSSTWEGLDPELVKQIVGKFENDEELKLISEGKTEEVIQRRTEKLRAQAERDVAAAREQLEAAQSQLGQKDARIKKLVLDQAVAQAVAGIEGFIPAALQDVIGRAHSVFTIDDESGVETPVALRSDDGTKILGKDGKTPLGVSEWLTGLVETECKHWLVPSGGGGAGGSGDGPQGAPDKEALDKLSPREKLKAGMAARRSG